MKVWLFLVGLAAGVLTASLSLSEDLVLMIGGGVPTAVGLLMIGGLVCATGGAVATAVLINRWSGALWRRCAVAAFVTVVLTFASVIVSVRALSPDADGNVVSDVPSFVLFSTGSALFLVVFGTAVQAMPRAR